MRGQTGNNPWRRPIRPNGRTRFQELGRWMSDHLHFLVLCGLGATQICGLSDSLKFVDVNLIRESQSSFASGHLAFLTTTPHGRGP